MPKKVNTKELKARIKANKVIMREAKKEVSSGLTAMMATPSYDPALVLALRKTISVFGVAAKAVAKDTAKL